MQLFITPSTCGSDCFEVTESTISKMFQHMTQDRCLFVPAFNKIQKKDEIPAISTTGTGTHHLHGRTRGGGKYFVWDACT